MQHEELVTCTSSFRWENQNYSLFRDKSILLLFIHIWKLMLNFFLNTSFEENFEACLKDAFSQLWRQFWQFRKSVHGPCKTWTNELQRRHLGHYVYNNTALKSPVLPPPVLLEGNSTLSPWKLGVWFLKLRVHCTYHCLANNIFLHFGTLWVFRLGV